jgi:hypothetical protein
MDSLITAAARARSGKRQVGMLEMLPRRIDMICDEGAPFANVIGPRRQHEVIDSELAAPFEEIRQRLLSFRSLEDIVLLTCSPESRS